MSCLLESPIPDGGSGPSAEVQEWPALPLLRQAHHIAAIAPVQRRGTLIDVEVAVRLQAKGQRRPGAGSWLATVHSSTVDPVDAARILGSREP